MADISLLMLVDQVRDKTLNLLEGVTETQARFAPPGLSNHILWHAGHSYVVTEQLTCGPLGLTPVIPAGWLDIFNWNTQPAIIQPNRWPPLAAVVRELRSQKDRLKAIIQAADDATLDGSAQSHWGSRGKSRRWEIMHGFHDEAGHGGEIWLLRKLQQ